MPLSESISVALFCMVVVFAVLGMLWAIIRIFSYAIRLIEYRNVKGSSETNH